MKIFICSLILLTLVNLSINDVAFENQINQLSLNNDLSIKVDFKEESPIVIREEPKPERRGGQTLNAGEIAAIVIGCVIFVSLVGYYIFTRIRRRNIENNQLIDNQA